MILKLKILAIGDTADNIFTLQKFSKKSKIHLINFPKKQAGIKTMSDDVEFFDSLLISKQVKKIIKIKDNFDLCIVMSWAAARIAYLSGINYIMYFVGGDITTPPFIKNPTLSYANESPYKLNFIERHFYKKVFDSAKLCITLTDEYFKALKKYRNDGIRLDRISVDTMLFNPKLKPINRQKEKFTFLSAQRIGFEKGFDKIWESLSLCKTDFEILQVEWFIEKTDEEKRFKEKILQNIPKQIKFIPLIKRTELGKYFIFVDAILGQMRVGAQGAIERDAAYCKKPVISYCDLNQQMTIDGEKITPPFLPNSNEPKKIAQIIDKIVTDEKFRRDLAEKEYEYIQKLSNPELVIQEWEKIFEKMIGKYNTINRKTSKKLLKIENLIANTLEKLVYVKKMRQKNIDSWGKDQYEELIN
jgi:glycosyltransferase involved in cell wall biosynthesis